MGGLCNHCASGRRERRSCFSTTSPNVSSKVMSSDPSLFFNSRQREGEFFKQGCGDKCATSLSSCSGPCGTNVSLSLFQAEMLNDPVFAKNVKGLEGMLRVRERVGESSRVCVLAPNPALQSGRRDAGSVAPDVASVGIEGGFCPPLRVHSAGCGVRDFSDGGVGAFSVHSSASTGCRACAPCPAENTREFKGTDCDDDTVTPSSKAGETG